MSTPTENNIGSAVRICIIVMCLLCVGAVLTRGQWTRFAKNIIQPSSHEFQAVEPVIPTPALATQPPKAAVDCGKIACLALTFDDGPHPQMTAKLLDILEREKVRATFFVVGNRVQGQEPLLRRMFYAGNEIGNHSWNHPDMTSLQPDQMLQQINQTQAAIASAQVPAPTLFRPPYGAVNASVRNTVPLTLALWNDDPLDWKGKDPVHLKDIIMAHARRGGVIDLHDIYGVTVDAMALAIPELKTKYQLVTFSELMNTQPGLRGEYFGR
jgi:peptidoglycan/xylan/chitin deacetylase (PgdA/CDA1 family)